MARLAVRKTYKMLIGGQSVRSESGRSLTTSDGANYCRSSRKDVRDAVKAARAAVAGWSGKTAMNRGQILYRMAEMLEARAAEFESFGSSAAVATDTLLHYCGWADKFQACLGTVNPVAAPYFDFSFPEPMGVVGVALPCRSKTPLTELCAAVAAVVVGGNTCVVLADDAAPLVASEFCEVLATSDLPGGVVNILTGEQKETLPPLAAHMDVNALLVTSSATRRAVLDEATENLKRIQVIEPKALVSLEHSLEAIAAFQETKTVWHPMGL